MYWLKWDYHVKDIAGAPHEIKKKKVGSELRKYHSLPHYDDDATVYSTYHQKLTGTQISLLSGIKQKISEEKH